MRKLMMTGACIALLNPAIDADLKAQEDNLVPNGSFENGDVKRLKEHRR